jgi:hypothetical protein
MVSSQLSVISIQLFVSIAADFQYSTLFRKWRMSESANRRIQQRTSSIQHPASSNAQSLTGRGIASIMKIERRTHILCVLQLPLELSPVFCISQDLAKGESFMTLSRDEYISPEIVYEGNLEIQAGSPLSIVDLEFEDYEW